MELLREFHWDRPLPELRMLGRVKGGDGSGRQVYRVQAGEAVCAMKVHRHGSLRKMWRAGKGRSLLRNERAMLDMAAAAKLPVPALLAHGRRRRWGLVTHDALLMSWIDGRQSLRTLVADAVAASDAATLNRAIDQLVSMLTRIRSAGIADRDFAFGQIMVDPSAADWSPVWLDLEAAFPSPPHDPIGTGATVGMALAGVWNASGGRETALRFAWERVQQHVPEPAGGWASAVPMIEPALRFGVEKGMRRGRIHHMPPPLA